MRRLLSSLPCSEVGMQKSLKLMHNGSASTLPNLLEWKKAIALHTLHIYMNTVLPTSSYWKAAQVPIVRLVAGDCRAS